MDKCIDSWHNKSRPYRPSLDANCSKTVRISVTSDVAIGSLSRSYHPIRVIKYLGNDAKIANQLWEVDYPPLSPPHFLSAYNTTISSTFHLIPKLSDAATFYIRTSWPTTLLPKASIKNRKDHLTAPIRYEPDHLSRLSWESLRKKEKSEYNAFLIGIDQMTTVHDFTGVTVDYVGSCKDFGKDQLINDRWLGLPWPPALRDCVCTDSHLHVRDGRYYLWPFEMTK